MKSAEESYLLSYEELLLDNAILALWLALAIMENEPLYCALQIWYLYASAEN